MAPGRVGHERGAPAVVAVQGHRLAPPFAVQLATPDQRRGNDIVPVAVDVGPNFDPLADDPLHRIAPTVDQRINVLDMESTGGALDSLSCFVHGDAAVDMEVTSPLREGRSRDLYTKPLTGIGSRGTAERATS